MKPVFRSSLLGVAPPVLLGIVLRLFGLSGQVLVDDEWHSLNFVLGKSFGAVLTTHGAGANCIPQNVLNWLLLHTVGWSETTLYFPSILFGVLGLLVFPALVARLAGRTAAILFTWLLAVSPCVVFYSRIVRPYSAVLFFGFHALLCLALWAREGRPRLLLAYALSGFAAIYGHLYAAPPVLAPLLALFLLSLVRRRDVHRLPPLPLLGTGILMAALLALFLGPAHWKNPWWLQTMDRDRVALRGLWDFLSLLAGTRFVAVKLLFAALAGYGLVAWIRKEFRIGLLWASSWAAFFLLLVFATQDGMHAGIQIARYNIVLFPVAMLLAASALDALFARLSCRRRVAASALLMAGLLAGSPLWRTFDLPNNFMHHSAFQDSYAPFDDAQSRLRLLTPFPQMPRERLHPIYSAWAADPAVRGIVEYPMYVGDPFNLFHYFQHFHRKPLAIGYVPDFPFPPLPSNEDWVFGTTPVDYVLARAQALGFGEKMRFRNLIPLSDSARLRQGRSGWLLVVHRDVLRETLAIQLKGGNAVPPVFLAAMLNRDFGAPVFSDARISAWRIP